MLCVPRKRLLDVVIGEDMRPFRVYSIWSIRLTPVLSAAERRRYATAVTSIPCDSGKPIIRKTKRKSVGD
jgi:hypothetical protein